MNDSLLITNGIFYRFDHKPCYRWLWIRGGVIRDAGFGGEPVYEAYCNEAGEVLDVHGHLALPGFCDSRVHVIQTALRSEDVDLSGADSWEEIGRRLHVWIADHPQADFVRAYGLEVSALREQRLPDRHAIDGMVKDRPVWIASRDFHRSMLNTKAFHQLNVPLAVDGVELDRGQSPTGILRGTVNALIRNRIFRGYSDEEKHRAVQSLAQRLIRTGVTSVHAMEGGYGFAESDAQFLHSHCGGLPVDITLYFGTADIYKVKNMGLHRLGGDIFIDGSFASRNAALSTPYADSDHCGELNYTQEEINELMEDCYRQGIRTALHAVGDRAMEQVLRAHEYAQEVTGIRGMRHRIEHAELCSNEQKKRAADLGLIFSMQPACELYYGGSGGMYEARLGGRVRYTNELRRIIDSGIVICGGSDSDLTPVDPLGGIWAAVNHPQRESAVSVEEAVKMFTHGGAYAAEEEGYKGQLEIGMSADIVVLDRNIFSMDPGQIRNTRVVTTIKNGTVLYHCPQGGDDHE